jgi:uncharacterized protein YrrD
MQAASPSAVARKERRSAMRIALGQDVITRDGVKVGKVDSLILNERNHHVEEFVVHKGLVFSSNKLIDRSLIGRTDEEGVHLTLEAADERKLPNLYDGDYYEWASADDWAYFEPMPAGMNAALLSATPRTPGRTYPGTEGFFEVAPIDGVNGRPESNLSEDDVVVGEGAEVVSADDHKLGHVHAAQYDDAGVLTGIVVRSGVLHKHDIPIPAAWIDDTGAFHVRLNVSAVEVEAAAAAAAEQG